MMRPVVHPGDPIRKGKDPVVVGHDHHGAIMGARDVRQEIHDDLTIGGIQCGRRLIANHHGRFMDQSARDGDPLLLPPGKEPRAVTRAISQPNQS